MLTFTSGTFDCQSMEIAEKAEIIITAAIVWKEWEFPHENHGILLQLHAPWFSRESMEFFPCFFHGFSIVFPWFSHAFSTRENELIKALLVKCSQVC